MNERETRVRGTIGDHLLLIVAIVALLALGGVYLTYTTHVEPGTETETIEEASWSSSGFYTHQATVVQQTAVFDQGDVLRNRGTYFEQIAPVLEGTFVYEYQTTGGGGALTVETEQRIVLRSVDDDTEFWRTEEPLGSETVRNVEPGDRVEAPFEFNVTQLGTRIDIIESQLGGTPGTTEIRLVSEVSLSGERIGESVETTKRYEIGVERGGNVYSVVDDDTQTDSDTRFREEEVVATYGPLRSIGAPALLGLSLLVLVGLAVGRYQNAFDVDDREREWLAHASAAKEFEEWISTGHVPDRTMPESRVSVDTLEDLVDVAVDSNRRVIEDTERELYLVLVEGVAYTYEPPRDPSTADPLTGPDAGNGGSEDADNDGSGDASNAGPGEIGDS